MSAKDVKLFVATFLAVFVVLSPAVQFLSLTAGESPNTESMQQAIYPLRDKELVGQPAPDPKMRYMNGEQVELSEFQGKTVVIYLWSTWSPIVPKGLWYLNQLHLNNDNPELKILAANIGFKDRLNQIERYIKRRNFELPVVLCSSDILAQFNVKGVPALFIIDNEGTIQYEDLGEIEKQEFEDTLDKITAPNPVE